MGNGHACCKGAITRCAALLFALLGAGPLSASDMVCPTEPDGYCHGFELLWPLKHGPDFRHLHYVNPDAPKGGTLRMPVLGTWDNFNSLISSGRSAEGLAALPPTSLLYDRLLEATSGEPNSMYGRLAEAVRVDPDLAYVDYRLREGARWHDGEPLTIDDVMFTFEFYKTDAEPWIRSVLRDVTHVEAIGEREVRYWLDPRATPNPSIPQSIGVLPVLPKHYWADRDITVTTLEPPLGSGPYRIAEFDVGRKVAYERVPDYWGAEVPVMVGRFNFDRIEYHYFRDEQVMLEAHRGHLIDVREESMAKNWTTQYNFPAARAGLFRQEKFALDRPTGLHWPIFWNLRRERFQDRRVREALALLYDWHWTNDVLNFGFYERGRSLFHGSILAHTGVPEGAELALLEPWRDHLPERLFTEPFEPPRHAGKGLDRNHLARALELFGEAGWVLDRGRLVHQETGERFRIQFVFISNIQARNVMPYADALERVGIATSVRVPETSNWLYRLRTGRFDASQMIFYPFWLPGLALRNHFGSAAAEQPYGVNWGYVRHPAVDAITEAVIEADQLETFLAAVRAADRVLMWEGYLLPGASQTFTAVVWWDKFGLPDSYPLERVGWQDLWWWDAERAARVERGLSELEEGPR